MNQTNPPTKGQSARRQHNVSVVFELVLLAIVLTLAGLAVYQANHRAKQAVVGEPAAVEAAAASAAKVVDDDALAEEAIYEDAAGVAEETGTSAQELNQLESSFDESAF